MSGQTHQKRDGESRETQGEVDSAGEVAGVRLSLRRQSEDPQAARGAGERHRPMGPAGGPGQPTLGL